jgi:hypothetical protein
LSGRTDEKEPRASRNEHLRDSRNPVSHDCLPRVSNKASILRMTPVSHTLTGIDKHGPKGQFVLEKTGARATAAEAKTIAKRFVAARQTGEPLAGFPGILPPDLAAAYACQDSAIELVPDAIAGWKVGLIGKDAAAVFQQDRLAGPIFSSTVRQAKPGQQVRFPVFRGGFAAVEAEFLLRLGRDQRARPRRYRQRFRQQRGAHRRTGAAELARRARRALAVRDVRGRNGCRPRSRRRAARRAVRVAALPSRALRSALAPSEGRGLGVDWRDHGRAPSGRRPERAGLIRRRR